MSIARGKKGDTMGSGDDDFMKRTLQIFTESMQIYTLKCGIPNDVL
jgi:hypothetical protein